MYIRCLALAVLFVVARVEAIGPDEQKLHDAILLGKQLTLTKKIVLSQDLPLISAGKTVTIKGSGSKPVTIDGKGIYRMFKSSGAGAVTLSLSNLILLKSKFLVDGFPAAAVDIDDLNSQVTISKVTFQSNARALYLGGTTAKISNSKFNGQTKTAVVVVPAPGNKAVTFTSCSFTGNKADDLIGGGAIHVGTGTDRATVIATKTTFTNNRADGSVGGAVNLQEFATGTFTECTFEGNYAPEGGAVKAFNAYFTTKKSTFKKNSAKTGGAVSMKSDGEGKNLLSRTSFTSNKASVGGAAFVINVDVDLSFCSCSFGGNTVGKTPNNGFVSGFGSGPIILVTPFKEIPLVTLSPNVDEIEYRPAKCI